MQNVQARCPSCRLTSSVRAVKEQATYTTVLLTATKMTTEDKQAERNVEVKDSPALALTTEICDSPL